MGGTPVASSPIASCYGQVGDTSLYQYWSAVLNSIGAPITYESILGLTAWALCEGPPSSQGGYNPLNTTLKTPHVLPGNAGYLGNDPGQNGGDPVKNYDGWANGVAATVAAMGNGIKSVLKAGDSAIAIATAQGAQHWGTNPACIASKITDYKNNPQALCKDIALPVNTNQTNQGGSGATADAGAATPINIPGESIFEQSLGVLISPLATILKSLSLGTFWKRAGQLLLGALLVAAGLLFILSETKTGAQLERTAGEAAIAA